MSSETAISVRGVGKTFRVGASQARATTLGELLYQKLRSPFARRGRDVRFEALRDVSFEARRGEMLGIVGRNGAGKSTLLKILSQITPPTRGEIDLRGRVGALLEVGTGFHPELTGRENIYLNGSILGMSRRDIERKFDSIVDFAETEQFLDTPVKRYSSGMFVRLAFAVAAHLQPDILIVDEVLAVGDLAFQRKCMGKMESAAHEGKTVILVSHNMAAISQLCTRVLLIDGGSVVADDSAVAVVARYLRQMGSAESEITVSGRQHDEDFGGSAKLRVIGFSCPTLAEGGFAFRWREPLVFDMRFDVLAPIRNAVIGLAVQTADGVELFGSHQIDQPGAMRDFEPGEYTCRISIENPLRAGNYTFSIGGEHGVGKAPLFLVRDAFRFDVHELSADERPYPRHVGGVVNVETRWQFGAALHA